MSTKPHPYTLVRSKRKSLGLEITRELTVLVRAPMRMPKRTIDAYVIQYDGWIRSHLARQAERTAARPAPTPLEVEALRTRARTELPPKVAHYARIMGVAPTGIKITSAQKRFGSCSGRDSLCFSYILMQYPEAAIDYVVVHELAHIVHKNHGAAFYQLVESVLPDWRQRRALLRT